MGGRSSADFRKPWHCRRALGSVLFCHTGCAHTSSSDRDNPRDHGILAHGDPPVSAFSLFTCFAVFSVI